VLNLGLKLVGGISIREYQTEAEGVAYSQLTVHGVIDDDGNRVPVIPGTSWAGALLARCKDTRVVQSYGNHAITLFGTVNEQTKEQMRSRVIIDESTVSGGTWKAYTRNSIDRFTGGTVDTALYSEEMYWGGTTKLVLTIRNVSQLCNDPSAALRPLVATLADLHNGFLAVGGLTAVGRGMFTIDQSQSTILVGGTNVTQEFFRAFMGNASNGFAQPNVAAVAKLLSEEPQTKGGAA
jgi:CRISPR/Cas system CMR subunit Cmr4 (Cas7 group RAMP superfamily)